MEGTTLRIENSSRAHAAGLHWSLTGLETKLIRQDGVWMVEVPLGELGSTLVHLFDAIGSWLEVEQVDSLLLHFDERHYTLLRPSKERLHNSNEFLLERVAQLETALDSRIPIEQAKGILALTFSVNPDEAFTLLRTAARDKGTELRDLAKRIVASPAQAEAIFTGAIHRAVT